MEHSLEFTLVRADLEHLEILTPLFDAYRVFYEQPTDLTGARDYLRERLGYLESAIFLALSDQQGLGFTQMYPSFTSIYLERIWILYDLYVVPEARGWGIGRALMERTQRFARESGAKRVELSTARDNRPAQALYESLGYQRDEAFYFYELPL